LVNTQFIDVHISENQIINIAFNPIRTGLFRTLPGPERGGGAITHDTHILETSILV